MCGENSPFRYNPNDTEGIPPCVWGKRKELPLVLSVQRGIPPRVWGKRNKSGRKLPPNDGIPPRVWGKRLTVKSTNRYTGIPPRVWGKRSACDHQNHLYRNTPTCVGKTSKPTCEPDNDQEYPHVCGENVIGSFLLQQPLGIPPCVWGKRGGRSQTARCRKEYPHVCGENEEAVFEWWTNRGIPPRVWGKLFTPRKVRSLSRNTPTCVGKTLLQQLR